ncbi:amidase [Jannaschia sp.]|nr:amidase [Jannaschia sp.]
MTVTEADIAAAERLLGLAYTARERAQMLDGFPGQIEAAQARRAVTLPNDAPMASHFDPRLPGFAMPTASGVTVPAGTAPCPASDGDIAFASVHDLGRWIRAGALTSARLTEIYLARIAALGARLECWATVTADLARAQADAADALLKAGTDRGPLHGIPYGLKDLFDTDGIVTGWGAEPYRDRIPETDARIVTMLREAGAVLLGKTTLGALAYGDVWYGGRTRNPWNLSEGSSGSSAGSASATAAGLCAFSIGTETLGSITAPSQRCGTTGLRPTFGRVSRVGGMTLCWSLDKVGPICRTVDDTALVLDAINGGDIDDRGSIAAPFHYDAGRSIQGLRVGYLAEAFGEGASPVDHAALDAMRGLGVEVVEIALPDLPYASLMNIVQAEAAAAFEPLTLTDADDLLTRQDEAAWPNLFRRARFLSAVDHVQLDRLRYRVMQALDDAFRAVDAMIGPFQTGQMLVASNFTGHPCLHLRAGFQTMPTRGAGSLAPGGVSPGLPGTGPRFEVPQGISLWGRLFEEGTILTLGRSLEAALDVADRRPGFTQ